MVRGLAVERRSPPAAFQGDQVRSDVIVRNTGRGTRLSLVLHDRHLQPAALWLARLDPGERATLTTVRRATRRGVLTAEPVVVSSAAPFGVAEARRRLPAAGGTTVYPRAVPLPGLPFLEGAPAGDRAALRTPRRGNGQDFIGIREYRLGDSMRHVHWASTARMGALMVREFEREDGRRLGVIVDTSADQGTEETPLDLCCSVAASVALAAMEAGYQVELAAARNGRVDHLVGADRARLLTWLAELKPGGGLSLADVVEVAGPLLRSCQTLLLAFPTWRENGAGDLPGRIAAAAGAGERHLVVAMVDASSFEPERPAPPTIGPAAKDRLERELASRGITVFPLSAKEDLARCLARLPPVA
jgi:uncharacterized protein (DUF58 family)